MSAHTPGPWKAVGISGTIIDGTREVIASVGMGRLPDEYAPDAALIAAAPDLLAACVSMCAHLEDIGQAGSLAFAGSEVATARYDAMRAAIAKAEGRS